MVSILIAVECLGVVIAAIAIRRKPLDDRPLEEGKVWLAKYKDMYSILFQKVVGVKEVVGDGSGLDCRFNAKGGGLIRKESKRYKQVASDVLTLQIGQSGIQIGSSVWELYLKEHGIANDGKMVATEETDNVPSSFFSTTMSGKNSPKTVIVDSDSSTIDNLKTGQFKGLFNTSSILDINKTYPGVAYRAKLPVCTELIEMKNIIRKQIETFDNYQGFLMLHSMGGGTGSTMSSYLINEMVNYSSKGGNVEMILAPSPDVSALTIEPYNALLNFKGTNMGNSLCVIADNQAMYRIFNERIRTKSNVSYHTLNVLLSATIGSMTSSIRYQGELNATLRDMCINLVPFPDLRYVPMSFAPIVCKSVIKSEDYSVPEMTATCFKPENQLLSFNPRDGQYMAVCVHYRGNMSPLAVNEAAQAITTYKDFHFSPWIAGFKSGITFVKPGILEGSPIAQVPRSACAMLNNTAVGIVWRRIYDKFILMYKKKAFLHWFTSNGTEEADFNEAQVEIEQAFHIYDEFL